MSDSPKVSAGAEEINERVQAEANARLWARQELAQHRGYTSSTLRTPEEVILSRFREGLTGRVLELGCGAGRLTGHLAKAAESLHAVDVSPAMIEACRGRHPQVRLDLMDLREIGQLPPASFDAVVAPYNVIDVLGDADRGRALDVFRALLPLYGFLILSSHNLAAPPPKHIPRPKTLKEAVKTALGLPRWLPTRRRLLPHEHVEQDYAVLNDPAHDYGLLHYYITRDDQERQLSKHGFALIDCLDLDGASVPRGERAAHSSELHYIARRTR